MTADFWRQAELFYISITSFLLISAGVLIFFLALLLIYHRKKGKKLILVILLLLAILGGGFLFGRHRYNSYESLSKIVTPAIRDRKKNIIGYSYFDGQTLAGYTRIQDIEGMEQLPFYQEETVTDDIEYLGTAYNSYYFKFDNRIYYLKEPADFQETDQAQLVGVQFKLKQPDFEGLGFFPESTKYFTKIVLPAAKKDLVFIYPTAAEQVDTGEVKFFNSGQGIWAMRQRTVREVD